MQLQGKRLTLLSPALSSRKREERGKNHFGNYATTPFKEGCCIRTATKFIFYYQQSTAQTTLLTDYIRYDTKHGASSAHAENVYKIIKEYKARLAKQKIPLQIDVFGISSFGEEKHIGQNVKLFSSSADAICPMLYPSHFEPFREHAVKPYETVYGALKALKGQFAEKELPFKLYPYIELSNYRYPLSGEKRLNYILAQIHAAEAAGADGWYAWSAHNMYDNLFTVLEAWEVK